MPKGVCIEDLNLMEKFHEAVQAALPFSLEVNKNLHKFSDLILDKTGDAISTSTLRRIFQHKTLIAPSLFSLDAISKTIGYEGWTDFVSHQEKVITQEHLEIINSIKYNGYKGWTEFESIAIESIKTPYCYEIVLALIQSAVTKNDIKTLSQLFDLPCVFEIIENSRSQYYFRQEMGQILRSNDLIYELIPFYAKHPVAQTSYIEQFVDEENLNGYYGELLEEYHKYKTTLEAQLFYHCLMYQRDLENGDHRTSHFDFLVHFRETEPVNAIPKMRRLAILISEFKDDKDLINSLLDEIPNLLNKSDNNYLFVTYKFCSIVFYSRNHHPIKTMLAILNSSTKRLNNIVSSRMFNILKIYEAFVLLKENQLELAENKLQSYTHFYFAPDEYFRYNRHYEVVKRLIDCAKTKCQN